ncbi:annexin A2 isoform X2 [Poecilia reticulata]|uniref:annexin A2 isoform X2 n=1 Tax=Poecilia reticulata TaxID=8081 RepID=UPI0007EA7298|nr:PREDICTED: annexin A2-like isoform X2 [Poecilia reticulata]
MDENFSSDMWWGTLGTIRPFPNFHPDRDAADIQAALERKDAAALVRILTNRSNAQRRAVAQSFQDETKQGLGTDEETLLEILCSRSRKTLQEVAAVYRQMYNKDLEKELKAETSGDFARLVVALLNKAVTAGSVRRDVQALAASLSGKKAEAGPWINILTSRDSDHLDKVLMELELETGQTVGQLVEKRFSGDFRLGLRVLVQCIQNPEVYLAQRLLTMKTSLVQGIMVSHSEEDLLRIRAAFLRLSGSSLYSTLQKHFKGEQLLALQAVCRSED